MLSTILFLLIGCDDYFTPESKSDYRPNYVFQNVELASQALNGVYAALCDDNLYSKKASFYYSMNTDIENISGNTDAGRRAIARYCANPTNSELYGPWSSFYAAIEKANCCIFGIENSNIAIYGNAEQKVAMHKLLGEALCLRALLYFDLVKNWGDVPFHTVPTYVSRSISLTPSNRSDILDALIHDLTIAQNWLPWAKEMGTIERVNKGFAKGLLARISLYNGGYTINPLTEQIERKNNYLDYYKIANSECREIIERGCHSLNPSFENIFKKECEYQQDIQSYEPLFEIPFGRLVSGELGYFIGVKHEENKLYGKSEAGMYATPNYFYSFDKEDNRRGTTCACHKYNSSSQQELTSITSLTLAKWRKEWITPAITGSAKYTGINFPIMRYADILLMFAETENELNGGPTLIAKQALKEVRKRAFCDSLHAEKVESYVNSLLSKENFFDAIVNERAWEFGGECIRKYDLIRWGLLESKLNDCKNQLIAIQKREGIYSYVPLKVYWKYNPVSQSIEIANIDETNPKSGYNYSNSISTKWSSNLTTAFINKVYEGDPHTKQLLPIPQQAVTNSEGKLQNHYGY